MPNQNVELRLVFQALSDPTRMAVIERLSRGSAAMSALAEPFDMALPSFSEHLDKLEECGLVRSSKSGRVRTYELAPKKLKAAERWLSTYRMQWERRLDQLDNFLLGLKEEKT